VVHRHLLLGPLTLVVIGLILLLRHLGYILASLDQWWPVMLILIGLGLIFRGPSQEETVLPKGPSPFAPPASQAPTMQKGRQPSTDGLILIGLGLALFIGNLLGGQGTGALILIALGLALLIDRIW
jgi:hypothetical protein